MANNSLMVPNSGIITQPVAWEVQEALHDPYTERHPNFIEGPSHEISMEELTYRNIIPTFSDNSLTISHQKFIETTRKAAEVICKSHPLSYAMHPLIDHDSEMAAQFEKEMRQYLDTLNIPAKKRAEQGLDPNPREPERKRFIISDITPEAVHRIHSQNKRGLCLVSDEFSGWFKNFNRYNNGSESEFWMSVFSHKFAMADRKSSASGIFIRRPFICVCGTIQPEILWELASNSRSSNGFLERILFVIPVNQDMGVSNI